MYNFTCNSLRSGSERGWQTNRSSKAPTEKHNVVSNMSRNEKRNINATDLKYENDVSVTKALLRINRSRFSPFFYFTESRFKISCFPKLKNWRDTSSVTHVLRTLICMCTISKRINLKYSKLQFKSIL